MVVLVPCEVRNDLLQPILVTDDNTVTTDWTVLGTSLSLFHCSQKGTPGNLSAIQG